MNSLVREAAPSYRVAHNADGCSTLELLAAIIGGRHSTETARKLIERYNLPQLEQATVGELTRVAGIGKATAVRLVAALELGRRTHCPLDLDETVIRSPADAAALLMLRLSDLKQEHFVVIGLDIRNRVRFVDTLYKGNVNTAIVRISEIFARAIREAMSAIVVAHNHPSGDPSPSPEDVALTKQIVQAGKLLDIDVLDHLVIGGRGAYMSLKERGLGF